VSGDLSAPSGGDWPTSTPEAEGIDRQRLLDVVLAAREGRHGRMTSLLVARNGRLVAEEYFNGWPAQGAHTMQSVSKSVTSLLVGLAIDRGALRLTDPVERFFPDYQPLANPDERKQAMTVLDLLTMRSGFDWNEDVYAGSPLQRMNDCGCDWLRYVLDWRMREPPGTRFEYVSGNTILLGGVVGAATGTRLDAFAEAELFGPLGFAGATWFRGLPGGLPHAGGGLGLRPRDMAKLGQLMVDGGRWEGRTIVPAEWVRASATRVSPGARLWAGRSFDYGYHWWVADHAGGEVITAAGAQGQWIFAVPSLRLVVASTASNPDQRWVAAVEVLFTLLPAVRG
jgi:CubicO group peptidase (beta-lactamase class C family)